MKDTKELEQRLLDLRKKIELVDKEISILFEKRMDLAQEIGAIKQELKMDVFDKDREDYLFKKNIENISNQDIKEYYTRLLRCMLELSKEYQKKGR